MIQTLYQPSYSCDGNAMDNIIYWGSFILILLAGSGVFGTQ